MLLLLFQMISKFDFPINIGVLRKLHLPLGALLFAFRLNSKYRASTVGWSSGRFLFNVKVLFEGSDFTDSAASWALSHRALSFMVYRHSLLLFRNWLKRRLSRVLAAFLLV